MKKELTIFLLVIIAIVFSSFINADVNSPITGDTITGEITNANVAVSITIFIGEPSLTITRPKNHTYITSKNLPLNFTSSNTQTIWYNIDNGINTTITGNTTFNTTQGPHTLYLHGNNSNGNKTSTNITFTVDSSKLIVIYDDYASSTKGISTDFNKSTYEDLQNLSNIVLENTDWGKILFNQAINVTDDLNTSDNEADLDTHINISSNYIKINSTALPNFNVSATLYLYNLTFSNPRILKDGVICPDTICTEIDYSTGTGTLIFNVTEFTVYSAEETPTGEVPSGGGGSARIIKDFSIDKERIKISLKQGETKKEQITIKNNGNRKTNFKVSSVGLEDFIIISETEFDLDDGKSKTISIDFIAREESIPDLYIGRIIVEADGIKKEILVTIEVESKGALFDIEVNIPLKFKYVLPGEEAVVSVKLTNLGEAKRQDVEIEYIVKNKESELIISEKETIAVETTASLIKTLQVPKDAKHGEYIIYVKVVYNEKTASASEWFTVGKTPLLKSEIFLYILIILLIIFVFVVICEIRKIKKEIKHYKIDEYTLAKEGLIK